MSKREIIEKETESLLEKIAEKAQVTIYDVEYVKEGSDFYLRCYIDKEGGVSIDDCETVSRALSDELDQRDYIEDAYILEVSSPGLGRTLKKDRHLANSLGERVELKTFMPHGEQKEFEGILKAFDDKTVTLLLGDSEQEEVFTKKETAVIKLALDF